MVKPAPKTIRITPDVWEALASRAEPFETPNEVLRRLLGLSDPTSTEEASGPIKEIRSTSSSESNRFGARGAAGYVVGQLDDIPRTEQELIQLAQKRSQEGLQGTRYATDDTVECPALRELARAGRVFRKRGSDGRWRYSLTR